jgi:hypothetical protein
LGILDLLLYPLSISYQLRALHYRRL